MTSVRKDLTGTAVQAIRAMSDAGIPLPEIAACYGITVAHAQQLCAVRPPVAPTRSQPDLPQGRLAEQSRPEPDLPPDGPEEPTR